MTNSVTLNDFNSVCLVCLNFKSNLYPVNEYNIITMLEECLPADELVEKKFPQQICDVCFTQLRTAYEFKQQYLLSVKYLKKLILDSEEQLNSLLNESLHHEEEEDLKYDSLDYSPLLDIKEEEIEKENKEIFSPSPVPEKNNQSDVDFDINIDENTKPKTKIKKKIKKNANREYNCDLCTKTFQQKKYLRLHKLSHTKLKPYQCTVCSSTFKYSFTLTSHMKIKHEQNESSNVDNSVQTCLPLPEANGDREEVKKPRKKRIIRRRKQNYKGEYICDVCGKTFQHKKNLRVHKISHSNLKPYECSVCHSTFKYSFTLTSHMKIKHTQPDRREICFVCGKSVIPNSLSYHLSTHSVVKQKFKCDICAKEYCQKSALRQHYEEKHTDCANQKYYCDICNKGYETRRTLQTHKLYIHNTDRKFTCHICEKNFSCPSSVRKHINAQHKDLRPHPCALCSKAFHTKTLLDKHRVTHTGERPYSCTVCGKSFGFKSVLSTHMKVHNK